MKKQLCEKFSEFDMIEVDKVVPEGLNKKVVFVAGRAELGKLSDPDVSDLRSSDSTSGVVSNDEDEKEDFVSEDEEEEKKGELTK